MKKSAYIILAFMFVIIVGCSKSSIGDDKTAERYVKSKGYKISDIKEEMEKYTLEKSEINTMKYQQIWGVQKVEPDKYFGKKITVYGFTVSNHPLAKIYKQSKGINVYIMVSEGKIVGGYSFPNNGVMGGIYSLNGKDLDEVSGLTYQQFLEKWKNKYGK